MRKKVSLLKNFCYQYPQQKFYFTILPTNNLNFEKKKKKKERKKKIRVKENNKSSETVQI